MRRRTLWGERSFFRAEEKENQGEGGRVRFSDVSHFIEDIDYNGISKCTYIYIHIKIDIHIRACVRACVCVCVCERERERERERDKHRWGVFQISRVSFG